MSRYDDKPVTLCAVGDLSLGDSPKMVGVGVRAATSRLGGNYLFEPAQDYLLADLVFGNLEGVLSDDGFSPDDFYRAQLRGNPVMAPVLRRAGFNVVSVANNHMMQYGPKPFNETCDALLDQGIAVVGRRGCGEWKCDPTILSVRGLRIGFLGYADADNYGYEPLYALNRPRDILMDVSRLQEHVDVTIVSLHWGDEFVRCPSSEQRTIARKIADAGANLIIGHHPHVIQPVERYNDCFTCFSLGNFVSDMVWNPIAMEGLVVNFELFGKKNKIKEIAIAEIGRDYAPVIKKNCEDKVRTIANMDEKLVKKVERYKSLVNSRLRENRRRAHFFLLANANLYAPSLYWQIWVNSLKSLLGIR